MNVSLKNIPALVFFILTLLFSANAFAQTEEVLECQTVNSAEALNYFNAHKKELKAVESLFAQKRSANSKGGDAPILEDIPVKVHIIRYSNGTGGLNEFDLTQTFRHLNNEFNGARVGFSLWEGINFIDNSTLMRFKKGDEKTLIDDHYVPGILNIYFSEYVTNASKASICGYSENTENRDIVVLKNSCAMNSSTLAHEIGHILSLVHTHGVNNTSLTTELVDGSNCDTDGDGICDTPADPGLSDDNVNNFCKYTGKETDANGDAFTPDTSNMMSYSRKACRSYFSTQQIIRMYTYFILEKNRFTKPGIVPEVITETPSAPESLNAVKLYPNPIQNENIHLTTSDISADIQFQISNYQGQILASGRVKNNEIEVGNLSSGSYLLYLNNGNSTVTRKFIK